MSASFIYVYNANFNGNDISSIKLIYPIVAIDVFQPKQKERKKSVRIECNIIVIDVSLIYHPFTILFKS